MKRRPRFSFSRAKAIAGGAFQGLFARFWGTAATPLCCGLGLLRALLFACIVLFPSLAQAARILLVQPSGSELTTLETFNRLRGELRVHGFQILLVEGTDEARPGANDLAAMTELYGAQAGVSLVRASKPVSAEIWIPAPRTGADGVHTVLTSGDRDAPLLLAIRVVDLLRTSLHESTGDYAAASASPSTSSGLPSPEVAPPASPVARTDRASRPAGPITGEKHGNSPSSPGAQDSHQPPVAAKHTPGSPPVEKAPRPAPPRELVAEQPTDQGAPAPGTQDTATPVSADGSASAAPLDSAYRFSLSGGLVASFDYHLGFGLGPAVSVHFKASRRLGLALGFIGPVVGQSYEGSDVTARVREEMLFLLVTFSAWRHGRIAQNVFMGPGGMHVAVEGEARQPLAGRDSSTWVGLAQVGTGISYQVLSRLSIELSASALLLVPQPAIEIAESRHPMGDPQFLSCFALHLGL